MRVFCVDVLRVVRAKIVVGNVGCRIFAIFCWGVAFSGFVATKFNMVVVDIAFATN